ncbi:MAG: Fe-S protein assembly chaperone HscA [Bryobacterales bacterium]|nr:Fe-S protein assembly chaperone HscA [Bryobacterales bacterium]
MPLVQIDHLTTKRPCVVGIDLGTTNSLVACMKGAAPQVIPGEDGRNLLPSVVSYAEDGRIRTGNAASELLRSEPRRTVYSVKRLMGRARADVADELALFPFHIAEDSDSIIELELGPRRFTPPQISAFVLNELKRNAERWLGEPVEQAVVTVPAYFNDAQRQATRDAGRIAGLDVLRLVNEPTAAALAYGLDKRRNGIVAVYDFGGGTFDISILKLQDGIFEVLATHGDTHLGGDDIDNLLLRIALEDIAQEWGEDLAGSAEAVQLLRQRVVAAKEELSRVPAVSLHFEWRSRKYEREIRRPLFERLITDIVERTLDSCRQCIRDAGAIVEQIDEVVLVGGSTRIPLVREAVERLFRARPHTELNPDEVVALGAAVQAAILSGDVEDQLLLDVTPLSLGIETMGGVVSRLIRRNSTIPASATETFTTAVDGQTNVLIHVLQGERELATDCRSLARFDLKGIDPQPAGMARVQVRFLIDANGILSVTARDLHTGREQAVEVKPSYGLQEAQVEAMIRDSIDFADEDLRARLVREARLEADTVLAATGKARSHEAYGKLAGHERQAIDLAASELLMAYHSDDHRLIKAHIGKLNQATLHLAGSMMATTLESALKGAKIE